jgi:hypothetical protein
MEDISFGSGRPPEVNRPEGSATLFLTFRGTREQKVRDRDTRIRIALKTTAVADTERAVDRRREGCGVIPTPPTR